MTTHRRLRRTLGNHSKSPAKIHGVLIDEDLEAQESWTSLNRDGSKSPKRGSLKQSRSFESPWIPIEEF
ncbi:unnamed protein product [Brassica rapa]|uniref:Uncharacterized protein n=2 Tax=Brassica TaxID=3705 RepID=A0A8D9MBM9_BRACM|nr:unnamed protein product [Brassica napus]CAG7905888.1 unnamed protein product [Brassica rapa]